MGYFAWELALCVNLYLTHLNPLALAGYPWAEGQGPGHWAEETLRSTHCADTSSMLVVASP